jgi:hypothetical protein
MLYRYSPRVLIVASFLILIPATAAVCFGQTPSGKSKIPDLPNRVLVLDGSPVHDVGELRVHASNWGAIGSMPGTGNTFSDAPSAEWPTGSSIEYLFVGGLWVGALHHGVPAVSTAAYTFEFRPSASALDIVYYSAYGASGGKRIPSANADDDADGSLDEDPLDGFDNDLDGLVDEDFAAISDQMLARRCRDDDPSSAIYPEHNPMGLFVHEESYQFSHPDYDDFVGFTYSITNDGDSPLEDVYVGVFADGDVGYKFLPNYWNDDLSAFRNDLVVDHGTHGMQPYDFAYWFDANGDGGNAAGYCGIVILDHPTGAGAPAAVGVVTYADFYGSVSFENGGDPTNDFERYELMSSEYIEPNSATPQDHRTLVVVGPFAEIALGETIEFSFALVVTPRDDFTHVERAAKAYHGLWFDLDGNPATGIDGKEHQEHWYLPHEDPLPIAITSFDARAIDASAVKVGWEVWSDEAIAGFELLRATGGGELQSVTAGLMPANTRWHVDETVASGAHYEYVLVAHGVTGSTFVSQRAGVTVPSASLALRQNAPNPFTETTTIAITLPERTEIEVAVFDVAGRRVATIADGTRDGGDHELSWNGTDDAGQRVGAGVYFYRLEAGNRTLTRKLLIMR